MAVTNTRGSNPPEQEDDSEEMRIIPVLTVLENNFILDRIFLLNLYQESEFEEFVLTFGGHPECNVVLTHWSVSDFHVEILVNTSSTSLSVNDLSSEHGTWVHDKKIEPGAKVELKEGDTLRFGRSSRLYELHWFTLNQAYDLLQEEKSEKTPEAKSSSPEGSLTSETLLDDGCSADGFHRMFEANDERVLSEDWVKFSCFREHPQCLPASLTRSIEYNLVYNNGWSNLAVQSQFSTMLLKRKMKEADLVYSLPLSFNRAALGFRIFRSCIFQPGFRFFSVPLSSFERISSRGYSSPASILRRPKTLLKTPRKSGPEPRKSGRDVLGAWRGTFRLHSIMSRLHIEGLISSILLVSSKLPYFLKQLDCDRKKTDVWFRISLPVVPLHRAEMLIIARGF